MYGDKLKNREFCKDIIFSPNHKSYLNLTDPFNLVKDQLPSKFWPLSSKAVPEEWAKFGKNTFEKAKSVFVEHERKYKNVWIWSASHVGFRKVSLHRSKIDEYMY